MTKPLHWTLLRVGALSVFAYPFRMWRRIVPRSLRLCLSFLFIHKSVFVRGHCFLSAVLHLQYMYGGPKQPQDFRSQPTPVRLLGGYEESDMYIVERAKAIERARAAASRVH